MSLTNIVITPNSILKVVVVSRCLQRRIDGRLLKGTVNDGKVRRRSQQPQVTGYRDHFGIRWMNNKVDEQ